MSHWTPIRALGEGGMSDVLLVEHAQRPGLLAAKKRLRLDEPSASLARLRHEAALLADCRHPNMPRFIALLEDEHALVMEYIEGEDLRARVLREGALSVDESLRITQAIASALGYLHRRSIWHRDVKAANILLGADGHPWLVDLGVSLSLSSTRLHDTETLAGSPRYAAPEVLRCHPVNPAKADLYGLGVVLFELLTGTTAFAVPLGRSLGATLIAAVHLKESTPWLDPGPRFPEELRALVRSLTAADPSARPDSAQDALRRLHRLACWRPRRASLQEAITCVMPMSPRRSWRGEASEATLPLEDLSAALELEDAPTLLVAPQGPSTRRTEPEDARTLLLEPEAARSGRLVPEHAPARRVAPQEGPKTALGARALGAPGRSTTTHPLAALLGTPKRLLGLALAVLSTAWTLARLRG